MAKQKAMLTMVMRWVWGLRLSSHFMAKWMTTPTPMATRKNRTVWMSTPHAAGPTRAGAQHAGEHHDADDVINDCRADDGRTKEALEIAQLLQVATVMRHSWLS